MRETNDSKTNIKQRVVLFRLFAFVFALLGVLETTGLLSGEIATVTLFAYTTQSNMLVTIFFGVLLIKSIRFNVSDASQNIKSFGFYPRLSAYITIAILVTLIIFWTILVPINNQYPIFSFNNMSVHLITPLLMVGDYLFFNERGKLKKSDTYFSLIFPLCYIGEAMILGQFRLVAYPFFGEVSYYPYPFLDVDKFGIRVLFMVLGILVLFWLIGAIWRSVDNRLAANASHK